MEQVAAWPKVAAPARRGNMQGRGGEMGNRTRQRLEPWPY